MTSKSVFWLTSLAVVCALVLPQAAVASVESSMTSADQAVDTLSSIVDVQKYNRSIHIMAMLIVGFGFLMVFVKRYGLSAVTATYLLVSVSIPLYFVINSKGIFGHPQASSGIGY